ncbi:unnamed protein product [Oppiella nova]|uniref:Ras-related protein Rab n=1 Tax=Oppiella nova TaxID=334625 RepID=A0A7R9QUL1_9ACAR|nr:unnamed protein product [Oppiella nova]CAG2175550.1 unnamed protein product [Oppiella nova]
MTRVYYKEAVGAFLVFDVSRPPTFEAILKWKHDLDTKVCLPDGSPIPCLLLANKCDMPKEGAANSADTLDKFCEENGFCGWYYTSAKDNVNVDESAKYLVAKILQRQKTLALEESTNKDILTLDYSSHGDSTRRRCNC